MLTLKIKIQDKQISKRIKDDNGYLIIKDNPIAKAGVFDYLLSEINENVSSQEDRVVKVYRPFEDLKDIKDSFANKPIKYNHVWVGEDDNQADGAIGSIVTIDNDNLMLRADLIIYNPKLIEAIESGEIVELSPGYTGEVEEQNGRFEGETYDYIQKIKCVNHLAVVEQGRSGPDLKIQDDKNKIMEELKKMKKSFKDSLLSKFKKMLDEDTTQEIKSQDEDTEEVKTQDEDKREIIREIMAIANKPAEDFEGGEDERERTIAGLAEKLAYNPSETSKTDDEDLDEDKKETKDEDIEINNDDDNEAKAEEIAEVVSEIVEKKLNEFEDRMFKKTQKIQDTYSKVSQALGYSFDYTGKTENDLYKFGYKALTGNELDKGLDAKTAFNLAYGARAQKTSFADSAINAKSNQSDILNKLNALRKK